MVETRTFSGLNNNQLKIIAMISMLLDHIGYELFPQIQLFRAIGRLAFPIFAYMIAEGCLHTRNRKKYFGQIAILAVACQMVYLVVDGSWYLGILITFSLAILTIFCIDLYRTKKDALSFAAMAVVVAAVLFLALAAPVLFQKSGFAIDYGLPGIALPVAVYYVRDKRMKLLYTAAVVSLIGLKYGGIWWCSLLALPLLMLYNNQRGRMKLKYLFYIFYPSHLAAIYLVGMLL